MCLNKRASGTTFQFTFEVQKHEGKYSDFTAYKAVAPIYLPLKSTFSELKLKAQFELFFCLMKRESTTFFSLNKIPHERKTHKYKMNLRWLLIINVDS